MITKYIKGDITDTELKYIAHGVNCQNVMGSGVAKALFTKWPEVKSHYHEFCKYNSELGTDLLGQIGFVNVGDKYNQKLIANCFTQRYYGYDEKRYVDYFAITRCFLRLKKTVGFKDEILAIPKIGCGLAGGDWNIVEQLINDTVGDELEIWVYEL